VSTVFGTDPVKGLLAKERRLMAHAPSQSRPYGKVCSS
jgi:hypothetical protein